MEKPKDLGDLCAKFRTKRMQSYLEAGLQWTDPTEQPGEFTEPRQDCGAFQSLSSVVCSILAGAESEAEELPKESKEGGSSNKHTQRPFDVPRVPSSAALPSLKNPAACSYAGLAMATSVAITPPCPATSVEAKAVPSDVYA